MPNAAKQLDFDEVANLFVSLSAHITPSEVHGVLSGQLAAGKRMQQADWLNEAKDILDTDAGFSASQEEQLQFFYMATLTPLSDSELSFQALIPDDDLEMELRLQCLGLWCSGFLAGFALVEKTTSQLPELVNDALNDLAAIAQVGANDDEDLDESAEQDFFQIVEYVRLAAMNVFIEYAPKPKDGAQKKSADDEYLSSEQLFKGRKVH